LRVVGQPADLVLRAARRLTDPPHVPDVVVAARPARVEMRAALSERRVLAARLLTGNRPQKLLPPAKLVDENLVLLEFLLQRPPLVRGVLAHPLARELGVKLPEARADLLVARLELFNGQSHGFVSLFRRPR